MAVNADSQFPSTLHLPGEKAMEHERQMPLNDGKFLVDDLVALVPDLILKQPIEVTPDYKRAGIAEYFNEWLFRDLLRLEYGDEPVVIILELREIPLCTAALAVLGTHHSQSAALRERRGL